MVSVQSHQERVCHDGEVAHTSGTSDRCSSVHPDHPGHPEGPRHLSQAVAHHQLMRHFGNGSQPSGCKGSATLMADQSLVAPVTPQNPEACAVCEGNKGPVSWVDHQLCPGRLGGPLGSRYRVSGSAPPADVGMNSCCFLVAAHSICSFSSYSGFSVSLLSISITYLFTIFE